MSSSRKDSAENNVVELSKFRTLLRTLGLGIITFLGGNDDEPPKVLVDSSRRLAIARCAIHIIPAFVSVGLIVLNILGFFVGNELQGIKNQDELKLGFLQVAAKVQELLIVASVGSVIFHLIRSELVFGDGMTLGLLVSGFSFAQVSYFWSPEFLGSLSWGLRCRNVSRAQRWKRRGFVLLVFIGGALALLAGPATAVLMIPRRIDWPVGGGIYWLNGSDEQLWPKFLDASYYSEINCTLETGQFFDNRCPSHGFLPMYQHFISWWNGYSTGYAFELNDGFQRKMIYARPALLSDANTWAYTAHAATVVLQDGLRGYHHKALKYLAIKHPNIPPFAGRLDWAKPKRYQVETKVPAARVFCELQGIMDLGGGNLTVKFPNLKGLDEYWEGKGIPEETGIHSAKVLDEVDVLGDVQQALAARGILQDEKSTLNASIFDDRRDQIIIATDIWNATKNSLGLVILFKDLFNHTSVPADISPPSNVVACSIDARWAKGKTIIQTTDDYPIYHEYYMGRVLNLVQTELDFPDHMGYVRARPPPSPMMEDIRLSTDWYDMLSPALPETAPDNLPWLPIHGSKRTTVETLLINIYNEHFRQTELENLIATVFVDGLSRSGLIPNHDAARFFGAWSIGEFGVENKELAEKLLRKGDPIEIFPEPAILKSGNTTRMEMKAIYNGYVMTAQNWFDKLSMAGLLLHALIAIIHTIFVICLRRTGGAWDSILELIALTQRSTPPDESLLLNTSAGVRSLKTVKLIAWVEAPEGGETTALEDKVVPGGELQMRFKDRLERRDEDLKPAVDKMYGVSSQGYRPLLSRNTV
ncbi:hypothetical protein N0V84_009718 [Fusarium piperis]|uniref:Uncharacterized protein n=1 Tax=Fusarium piperis TaxID=1435070 RepID=A0A9W8W5S9_9HYPO|nr:hypothetical protein N0V84_009718 [Fusarium piperis]